MAVLLPALSVLVLFYLVFNIFCVVVRLELLSVSAGMQRCIFWCEILY